MVPLIQGIKKRQIHRARECNKGTRDWGGGGGGRVGRWETARVENFCLK